MKDRLRSYPSVQRLALSIKAYAHVLRVIGGGFFVLSLLSGVIWAVGADIEPIAYVLGLLSSLFLAAPSIANYVAPDRKPVREMTYEELLAFLLQTDPRKDWKYFSTNWAEEVFLKEDPRLRIRCRSDEFGVHNKDFREPWANRHPDPEARSYWYEYCYDSALIERFVMVSIDGGRAVLPLPKIQTSSVPRLNYKVAQLFDSRNTLDTYMKRSGLVADDG